MSPKIKEGTKSMKAIDFHGDLNEFLSAYNYQPELTKRLDDLQAFEFSQALINEIVLWKLNRYVSIDKENLQKVEGMKHLRAGDHRQSKIVIESLLNIHGVDLPMASTLLRFRNPEVFQIIDRHAYRAVYGGNYPLYQATPINRKISVYFDYIDELINLCKSKKLPFQSIDRILYIFDKHNNGRLKS